MLKYFNNLKQIWNILNLFQISSMFQAEILLYTITPIFGAEGYLSIYHIVYKMFFLSW